MTLQLAQNLNSISNRVIATQIQSVTGTKIPV